ncbi:MAG: phosphatase PAP2 family protein [Clostridia bacterium]|nr:phosphatase PAP2 family protein [Clostridia bacterium]
MKKFILKNFEWFILFICIIGFIIFMKNVFYKDIIAIDEVGYNFLLENLISDKITPVVLFITSLGGAICLITLSFLLLIVIKDKRIGISIMLNLLLVYGLNVLFKNILQRPRPIDINLIIEKGYSFPSGHSMVCLAFYGLLIYYVYKNVKNNYLKYSLMSFFCILIILIGISRIYLGAHYTSDVIAGFLISLSYLIIYIKFIEKFLLEKGRRDESRS